MGETIHCFRLLASASQIPVRTIISLKEKINAKISKKIEIYIYICKESTHEISNLNCIYMENNVSKKSKR